MLARSALRLALSASTPRFFSSAASFLASSSLLARRSVHPFSFTSSASFATAPPTSGGSGNRPGASAPSSSSSSSGGSSVGGIDLDSLHPDAEISPESLSGDSFHEEWLDAEKDFDQIESLPELIAQIIARKASQGEEIVIDHDVESFAPRRKPNVSSEAAHLLALAEGFEGEGSVELFIRDLEFFTNIIEDSFGFKMSLVNPSIPIEMRVLNLEYLLVGQSVEPHPLAAQTIRKAFSDGAIISGGLKKLIAEIKELRDYYDRRVNCVITFPSENVPERLVLLIRAVIQNSVGEEDKLAVEYKTDPSILGGFTIKLGDYFYDLSTATEIRNFESWMSEAVSQAFEETKQAELAAASPKQAAQ